MSDLSFLPGKFWLERGVGRDYGTLERFHYLPKRPATWCQVWTIRYRAPCEPLFDRPVKRVRNIRSRRRKSAPDASRVVAVAVLSYPTRLSAPRRRALGLPQRFGAQVRFANRHIRTISRVIVHPQFRALGLSSALVRCICAHCDTRYCEATAAMGRAHPFFERAGMKRFDPTESTGAVYYLHERISRPVPLNKEAGLPILLAAALLPAEAPRSPEYTVKATVNASTPTRPHAVQRGK